MEIRESLMEQAFSAESSDPYMFSLHIMEEISRASKIIEKKNEYETDGPHHRSTVSFEAIELVDDFSKILFKFDLFGEDGLLRVNIKGILKLHIEETGFFSQTFSDYYVKTVFPLLRKLSQDKINFFSEKIDKIFAN